MHFVDCGNEPASLQALVKYNANCVPIWDTTGKAGSDFFRNLERPFNRLCGYCERPCSRGKGKTDSNEVNHFRPRVHFPELTFEWENLIYACRRCNLKKGEQFPGKTPPNGIGAQTLPVSAKMNGKEYIDPSDADGYVNPRDQSNKAEKFFVFDLLGQILPNPDLDDREWSKSVRTICDLDLNPVEPGHRSEDLCTLRRAAFRQWENVVLETAAARTRKAEKLANAVNDLKPGFPSFVAWVFSNALNQS